MTRQQVATEASRVLLGVAVRVAFRFGGGVVGAVLLFGCGTPQPGAQPSPRESPPLATPVITPAPAVEIAPPVAEKITLAPVAEEDNIFFATGSTTVDAAGKEKLRQHADRLKLNPKQFVTLIAYTDDQGSRNYNLALTEERLIAVSNLLRTYGVSARQIRRNRSGRVKNLALCTSSDCRQQMRRVELVDSP